MTAGSAVTSGPGESSTSGPTGFISSRAWTRGKQCVLVLTGADELGHKEVLGLTDGYRESTQSWRELLMDLKRRGLTRAPELAIGDGALGFWAALREVFGSTREQRCWVHKTGNVLNAMPKSVPMLLWALMASGQIQMRKVDGWETLAQPIAPISLDLAA